MSIRTLAITLILVLAAVMAVGSVSAQVNSDCNAVGAATGGAMLTDLNIGGQGNAVPAGAAILCNIIEVQDEVDDSEGDLGAIGTSGLVPGDYYSLIDIFMLNDELNYYGTFANPMRVCFAVPDVTTSVVIFEEARTAYLSPIDEPARSVYVLEPVIDADGGYICGDTLVPGAMGVLTNVNRDPASLLVERRDRCVIATDDTCVESLEGPRD